ncbi:hypothetical protein NEMBOFW57_000103 [Staphylotrichum longicolle]|uniref:Zn(2)-C6 fungal-type domain-containing protein n=1 Tax=Staphylotrichum longicolle TaxID=669026 RepID=A0AAD4F3F9_9PEZI|nr:hypothetical protein NEMBOFW57_000103 [Staphylotrichum longicolle]
MADSYKPAPLDAIRVATKPQRVLACQLCQQRKVKCDRKFPCTNCVRGKAQCVPATLLPRQRRRRFPERELLARIRHYEAVLQQHKIKFDPLHPPASAGTPTESTAGSPETLVDPGTPDTTRTDVSGQDKATRPRAIYYKTVESEDEEDDDFDDGNELRVSILRTTWDRAFRDGSETSYHLLFGSPARSVDLAPFHPDQGKIFRLWQIYLDNVNPLLKVTHVPTLQARIVDAMGDLSNISASLEALLFGIYCVAILSISDEQCRTLFGSPKKEVLSGYQFACRQALVNCNILQTSDRDALTALFLNLISVRLDTDPRSLSSTLAVAIRLAQGMGYHNEANNAKAPPLEAEMRRRLWWALVVFDNRICEMLNYKTATLAPTWTCGTPLNLNDFELLPETKTLPPVSDRPTEALFVVLRSQLSDLIRHCAFHLDFIDPLLSTLAHAKTAAAGAPPPGARELLDLQRRIEDHTLALCDPANPLHFMTLWTTRGYIARNLLLEHCSRHAAAPAPAPPDHQPLLPDPSAGLAHPPHARVRHPPHDLPLTQGYRWHAHFHFPFLAYTFIVQHLRKRRIPPRRSRSTRRGWP